MSMKNSSDTIGNRSRDLPFVVRCLKHCSTACPKGLYYNTNTSPWGGDIQPFLVPEISLAHFQEIINWSNAKPVVPKPLPATYSLNTWCNITRLPQTFLTSAFYTSIFCPSLPKLVHATCSNHFFFDFLLYCLCNKEQIKVLLIIYCISHPGNPLRTFTTYCKGRIALKNEWPEHVHTKKK
jgi:hypothetical protein